MNIIESIKDITANKNCSVHITQKHVSISVAPQGINEEKLPEGVAIERKNPAELRSDLYKLIKKYEEVNNIEL